MIRDENPIPSDGSQAAAPAVGGDHGPTRTRFQVTRPAADEGPIALIRDLFSALHIRRLRGSADPRAEERVVALGRSLEEVAGLDGAVRLYRTGPHLIVNRIRVSPYPDIRLPARIFLQDLERLGVGGFEFTTGLDPVALRAFLDLYPSLGSFLRENADYSRRDGTAGSRVTLGSPCVLVEGITALPPRSDSAGETTPDEDHRAHARRTYFRAMAGAQTIVRQLAVHRVPELRKSRGIVHEVIDTLAQEEFSLLGMAAIQDFDPYTFQHSVHVSILATSLGQELGLSRRDLADLGVAALFHDMGKVQVPKAVLRKPGRFNDEDWAIMKTHPLAGARELLHFGGSSELAVRAMLVSAEHHLRFDASGYPRFGDGWRQGLFARIVTLADCFDAMTASRVYMKRPFTPDSVVRYMFENAGRMFDPDLLRLFLGRIGLYPVGSLVQLCSGELGLVLEPPISSREVERPRIRVLSRGSGGWVVAEPRILAEGPPTDARYRIEGGCHPQDHGVDVDALLAHFYLQPS